MELERFTILPNEATAQAIAIGRGVVIEELPERAVYQVLPNQSNDEHPLCGGEGVFPDDSLEHSEDFHELSAGEVIRFLWRDGKVPEWIDIMVVAVSGDHTVCELRCCGRYTACEDALYYFSEDGGRSPFGVKGPVLPPRHNESDAQRFSLLDPKVLRRSKRMQ